MPAALIVTSAFADERFGAPMSGTIVTAVPVTMVVRNS